MKTNVGIADRSLRIILAIVIGAVGVYAHSWLGFIALIPMGTAFVGTCPLYLPLGVSTVEGK